MSKQENFHSFSSFASPGENVQEGEAISFVLTGKKRKRQRFANPGGKMLDIKDKQFNIKGIAVLSSSVLA
jgi:hypothetical protein